MGKYSNLSKVCLFFLAAFLFQLSLVTEVKMAAASFDDDSLVGATGCCGGRGGRVSFVNAAVKKYFFYIKSDDYILCLYLIFSQKGSGKFSFFIHSSESGEILFKHEDSFDGGIEDINSLKYVNKNSYIDILFSENDGAVVNFSFQNNKQIKCLGRFNILGIKKDESVRHSSFRSFEGSLGDGFDSVNIDFVIETKKEHLHFNKGRTVLVTVNVDNDICLRYNNCWFFDTWLTIAKIVGESKWQGVHCLKIDSPPGVELFKGRFMLELVGGYI